MNIYATRAHEYSLDQFVGKNVWVKVHNSYLNDDYYTRILSSEPTAVGNSNIVYRCNIIPAYCVLIDGKFSRLSYWSVPKNVTNYKEYESELWRFHGDFLELITPVELLTTEDINDVAYFYDEDDGE